MPKRSPILFPPLPTAARCRELLAQFFAHAKPGAAVFGVFDYRGRFRNWSVSRSASTAWGRRHLWEPFTVRRLNGVPAARTERRAIRGSLARTATTLMAVASLGREGTEARRRTRAADRDARGRLHEGELPMTPARARTLGFEAARAGLPDRIPDEHLIEMSDEAIFEFFEGHAQGQAAKEQTCSR